MKDCVREAFVAFTAPLEGVVPWMYLDVKGLVTTAIGNLIDPIQYALPLPWMRPDGELAQRDEIAAEWLRLKSDLVAAHKGHLYAKTITHLRLTEEGVRDLVYRKLAQNNRHIAGRFADWETWPADAQLAVMSLAWACGPWFRFPRFEAAMKRGAFSEAAKECNIDETGNPGVRPRNAANRRLLENAARAPDPSVLYWPRDLEAEGKEEITLPDFPIVYARPDPPPRELPNLGDPELDDE